MSLKNDFQTGWGLGFFLAFGLILSAYLLSSAAQTYISNSNKIVVKGYSEREIHSNYATWKGSITTRASKLADSYQKLDQDLNLVLAYLNREGIEAKDLNVSAIQTSIHYKQTDKGFHTQEIEGYTLSYDLKIESADVKLVSSIADRITDLIKDDVEIHSYKPKYFYTKIDALKIEMLGEAAKDARARADRLTSNSGNARVGPLKSAHQGVFQITPIFSTTVSDYGENDTSTIEKTIKAVVTMEYGIK